MENTKAHIRRVVADILQNDPEKERFSEPLYLYLLKFELQRILIQEATDLEQLEVQIEQTSDYLRRHLIRIDEFLRDNAKRELESLRQDLTADVEKEHAPQGRARLENVRKSAEFVAELEADLAEFQAEVSQLDLAGEDNEERRAIYDKLIRFKKDLIKFHTERNPALERIGQDLDQLNEEISGVHFLAAQALVTLPIIGHNEVRKEFGQFEALRKRQKRSQMLYRFFLAILVTGFGVSFLFSNAPKFFFANKMLLLLGIALTLISAVVKEYWISPWVRGRRLKLQRKHLLKCLQDLGKVEIKLLFNRVFVTHALTGQTNAVRETAN